MMNLTLKLVFLISILRPKVSSRINKVDPNPNLKFPLYSLQQSQQKRWAAAGGGAAHLHLLPILSVGVNFIYSGTDLLCAFPNECDMHSFDKVRITQSRIVNDPLRGQWDDCSNSVGCLLSTTLLCIY